MSEGPVSALEDMLSGMSPKLDERPFNFMHVIQEGSKLPPTAFALIKEEEGLTLVAADKPPGRQGQFARITLQVHSALEGVGLTAAVSTALAKAGIACNVIAAFHHDHLFVPWERREEAMEILQNLSAQKG